MSGGSFNYLFRQDTYEPHELEAMAKWLRDNEMYDAAVETESFLRRADASLTRLWQAVEWFVSNDWTYEDVNTALEDYRDKRTRKDDNDTC
jgi:hypothetical protein